MAMNVQQIALTHIQTVLKANPLSAAAIEKLTGKKPTDRQVKKSQEKFGKFFTKVEDRLTKVNSRAKKREEKRAAKEAKKAKKDKAKEAAKKSAPKSASKKAAPKKAAKK